jgi:hypothetical protein
LLLLGNRNIEKFVADFFQTMAIRIGACQFRRDLCAENRLRHGAERMCQYRQIEASIVKDLGDRAIFQKLDQIRCLLLASFNLDHVCCSVTG